MNKYAERSFTCKGCGASVTRRARPNQHYCSLTCYRLTQQRPQRKTGVKKPCAQCGVEIYLPASTVRPTNFCSNACHNDHQGRNKTSHICKVCSALFKWSPSRVVNQNPTYCSLDCRNACPDWRRNVLIGGNLKQQNSKTPTKLEIAGNAILDAIGAPYSTQVLIEDRFTVDAFVESARLVIQWDGDYWHGFRTPCDIRPFDERQKKRMRLDVSQDAYMRKHGYTVLRFWEHDVKRAPDSVRAKINEYLKATRK